MFPVLFTVGNFPVSSYGLFLVLGIFFGAFSVWRIARSFDFDAEKVLDLIFLTIGAGFLVSRAVFVLSHLDIFDSLTKIFFVNRYPGLSFWGGLFGGLFALSWLAKRSRITFLQASDIAMIGFFIAAFFTEIGCLLGACGTGLPTTSILSVDQAGAIGKRVPVQLYEALVYLVVFIWLWKKILRFHIQGSFLARGLVLLGLVKIIAGFYKETGQILTLGAVRLPLDLGLAVIAILVGGYFHYKIHKKTPLHDIATFFKFFVSRSMQKSLMTKMSRGWYNLKVNLTVGISRGIKNIFKSLRVRSNPDKFRGKG